MRTLVTGANGFIGSHVVKQLITQGRHVVSFILPGTDEANLDGIECERVYGDVTSYDSIRGALDGCDTVIHLAAIYALWLPDMSKMWDVNVSGTSVVLNAARDAGVKRVVYTSSIAALGNEPGRLGDESLRFNTWANANDYVRSKYVSEQVARGFIAGGMDIVFCNPAFPFGTADIGPTPTGRLICMAANGILRGWTDGGICAVDVENVAAGHLLAEEKGRTGERYILGEHNVTWREFYRLVCERTGRRFLDQRLPTAMLIGAGAAMEQVAKLRGKRPLFTSDSVRYAMHTLHFDTSKAHDELGMPRTPLAETLDKAVAYFRSRGKIRS